MAEKVIIYGKSGWPYTDSARSAYGKDAQYIDVKAKNENLEEMLKHSGGARKVPVIVQGEKVTIGHGGTWGVWWLTVGDGHLLSIFSGKLFLFLSLPRSCNPGVPKQNGS